MLIVRELLNRAMCIIPLFISSQFINDLALGIINNGKYGVSFRLFFVVVVVLLLLFCCFCEFQFNFFFFFFFFNVEFFSLLFEDVIILFSEIVIGLQTQLNSLCHAVSKLKHKINMNESSKMVFRKGGDMASMEMVL